MKVDLTQMTEAEQKAMARKFREASCILCGQASTGYRKLHLGEKIAFLPVCDDCQDAPAQTLQAMMDFHK